ncbi:response regulator transcription factor [Methylopila sp. M107]|uniref:response regulator transcription factor n=1 Tax=Methylopila sp. M107 TaxID=1101190 RepID=UPI00036789EA|nr:response regulator transcription factor [Methylopila sp. M107]
MRILLVEDSKDQATAATSYLRRAGYAVDWAADAETAEVHLADGSHDLILLDLSLPKIDGELFLLRLRDGGSVVPVLVMSGRGRLDDKIRVLDLGADDFLTKPFDLSELEARMRALLRRPHGHATSVLCVGNLKFDVARRRVEIEGRNIQMGQREFRLLELFLSNMHRLLTKDALLNHLFSFDDEVAPNVIELYVSRLRKKLAETSIEIRTVWGEGYVAEPKRVA